MTQACFRPVKEDKRYLASGCKTCEQRQINVHLSFKDSEHVTHGDDGKVK